MKGTAVTPKPNKETAIPATFLCLASKSNPSDTSKNPKTTIPKAIGFIFSWLPLFSECANDLYQLN